MNIYKKKHYGAGAGELSRVFFLVMSTTALPTELYLNEPYQSVISSTFILLTWQSSQPSFSLEPSHAYP